MDDDQALRRLPQLARAAVLQSWAGVSIEAIARQLGIEPASVQSLIELSEAKITRLRSIE